VAQDEVDRLYGLPLEDFTKERNAAAARIRKEGDGERAEEIKALPKPTLPAWAVNQLARRNEVLVRALLRAGERLRAAQEKALAGKGAGALREATREERDVVQRLVAEAREVLPRPSQPLLERIAETLRAAAVDEEGRELLKRGRLTRELSAGSGFAALEGMPTAQSPRQREATREQDDRAERKRRLEAARERVTELRREARDRERDARDAEREAERMRAIAEEAARARDAAEEELRSMR
jgi:hypothetical protein